MYQDASHSYIHHSMFWAEVPGGGSEEEREAVLPEITHLYPENHHFGDKNPACGIYFRHVKNLSLSNVNVEPLKSDERNTLFFVDVQELRCLEN